jgi:UPF0271 protein
MKYFEINCDVGEGLNNEADIMLHIQACNIACGGHAGDIASMKNVVDLAIKNRVKIGAHPSYPDKENFGRKSMIMKKKSLQNSIKEQVNTLKRITIEKGAIMHHIKPHGALYNDIASNEELALVYIEAIQPYREGIKIYVPYNSAVENIAIKYGFSIIQEAFADRNYNDDLSLLSRKEKNALITDPNKVLQHVFEMLNDEKVTTISGNKISINAQTFCVHSDTKNALKILKRLNQKRIQL